MLDGPPPTQTETPGSGAELIQQLETEQAHFLAGWVKLLGFLLFVACAGNAVLHIATMEDLRIVHYLAGMAAGAGAGWLARTGRSEQGLVLVLIVGGAIISAVHLMEIAGDTALFYMLPLSLMGALILDLHLSAALAAILLVLIGVTRYLRPFEDTHFFSHSLDIVLVVGLGTVIAMVVRRRQIRDFERLRVSIEELAEARALQSQLRVAAEESARAAEDASMAKSRFLANMSHELRTPLNAIIGYAELVQEDLGLEGESARDLERIEGAGEHLLGIIDDVLDLARVESGGRQVNLEDTSFDEIVTDVVSWIGAQAVERGNALTVEVEPGLVFRTDRLMLRQILLNLLANANRFTENGDLVLRTRRSGNEVSIEVEDTGTGIAADQLDAIFEPFRQAVPTTSLSHSGTGLGLSLVRRFAEGLGTQVSVRSELGRGSCFTVTLPTS